MDMRKIIDTVDSKKEPEKVYVGVAKEDAHDFLAGEPPSRSETEKSPLKALEDIDAHGVVLEYDVTDDGMQFSRVWSGVVEDPLMSQVEGKILDEVALFGLHRCTAVTVNALLDHYHKTPLTLGEVPETGEGVLAILNRKGLAYRPHPEGANKTVEFFVKTHKTGAWYLVTDRHAMALVDGVLHDAENRGPDGRRLLSVMEISRR